MKRFGLLLAGLVAAAGMALGSAGAASATVLPPVYSQYLAGHVATGTDSIGAFRTNVLELPNLGGAVPADTNAHGGVIARTSSGGYEYSIAVVWDDPTDTALNSIGIPVTNPLFGECAANQWVLEAGRGLAPGPAEPLAPASLYPLLNGGTEVCLNPGDGIALQVFFSPRDHEVLFADGNPADNALSTVPGETIAAVIHGVHGAFYAAGVGVDTTSGPDAGLLTVGTTFNFQGAYLERTGSLAPVPFDSEGMYSVTGTVTGGAPNPTTNPVVLANGVNVPLQAWTVTVP